MSGKIVCAVDGSETALRAIPVAAKLARADDATLVLVAVDKVALGARSAPFHHLGSQGVQGVLETARAAAQRHGVANIETVGLEGTDVAQVVLDYAETEGATHIVVGTGDKGLLTRATVGSVSHDLVVRAHCSVTVAR